MSPNNRKSLDERVIRAAETALAAEKVVSPIDVLVGIGWLDFGAVKRWRQGQLDYLEQAIQANPQRIAEAMNLLRSWATAKGLIPGETDYLARAPQRQELRFSASGRPDDRTAIPHALAFAGALRGQARAPSREGEPCPGAGRDPAA